MSSLPRLPEITGEDLSDPRQFRVKYEMDPFGFEITRQHLKFGGYVGLYVAGVNLAADAAVNGIDESMLAFPVHEAEKVIHPIYLSISGSVVRDPLFTRSSGQEDSQAVITALPKQPVPPAPLEYRAGVAAGLTTSLAFGTVALLSSLRYGKLLRKKHFKSKKSDVEALEAAYANPGSDDTGKTGQ